MESYLLWERPHTGAGSNAAAGTMCDELTITLHFQGGRPRTQEVERGGRRCVHDFFSFSLSCSDYDW